MKSGGDGGRPQRLVLRNPAPTETMRALLTDVAPLVESPDLERP